MEYIKNQSFIICLVILCY